MPTITDLPPKIVKDAVDILKTDLDKSIPKSKTDNILIATWNIRSFGDLTEEWEAKKGTTPQRDLQSLLSIIEIIKRFDIIAIQEVKGNIKCLRHTMKMLGDDWSFIMTDVTKGQSGNSERLAFIFRNKKALLSGLACEIVIPEEELTENIKTGALSRQFARTPYAVSFRAGDNTFVLLTLHVLYGDNEKVRISELTAIANWISDWAKELKSWNHGLISLGDFNIERKDDEAYKAFISKGLFVPDALKTVPRMLNSVSFYDQIAWFCDKKNVPQISMKFKSGGSYNFKDSILKTRNYTKSQLSYKISDHFPLWTEFLL
jgi:exonuclease III